MIDFQTIFEIYRFILKKIIIFSKKYIFEKMIDFSSCVFLATYNKQKINISSNTLIFICGVNSTWDILDIDSCQSNLQLV